MTDAPPPGWYPDPAGGAAPRWWTGRDWAATAPAGPVVVVQPALPPGTTTSTVWIWLQAVLPLVSVLTQLPYLLSFSGYFTSIMAIARAPGRYSTVPPGLEQASGVLGVGFAVTSVLSLVVGAAWVVFALLDERALQRRGIVQPFPWGWAFLSAVYPVGRAVVVRRRTGRGLAPLWLLIGTFVAGNAAIIALAFALVLGVAAQIPSTTPVSGA